MAFASLVMRDPPTCNSVVRKVVVGRVIDDAMDACGLAFKDDGMRFPREAERASVDDAKTANIFDERAMTMPDEHGSRARRVSLRPAGCECREATPVEKDRKHAVWSDRHVGDGRHVRSFAHRSPLRERSFARSRESRGVFSHAGRRRVEHLLVGLAHACGIR